MHVAAVATEAIPPNWFFSGCRFYKVKTTWISMKEKKNLSYFHIFPLTYIKQRSENPLFTSTLPLYHTGRQTGNMVAMGITIKTQYGLIGLKQPWSLYLSTGAFLFTQIWTSTPSHLKREHEVFTPLLFIWQLYIFIAFLSSERTRGRGEGTEGGGRRKIEIKELVKKCDVVDEEGCRRDRRGGGETTPPRYLPASSDDVTCVSVMIQLLRSEQMLLMFVTWGPQRRDDCNTVQDRCLRDDSCCQPSGSGTDG